MGLDKKIVLASGNKGKVREFIKMFTDLGLDIIPQTELGVGDVPETGTTFVENAIIKARYAAEITGMPAIADDSGIEVDYLNGVPGIYSARYSTLDDSFQGSGDSVDANNNLKLLDALKEVEDKALRTARYQCILVYMRHAADPTPIICQAAWEGIIMHEQVGDNGFGYDPLFWVPEHNMSSAQLDPDVKNRMSHRGKALRLLHDELTCLYNKEKAL
ncbi:MAG: RdgB/HAM1 family non-canonical purine NTP pyrophosphatase [gamma proteobacterium symbiont of Taylorina sp.]|nr:RdgB/HAM1 family non-canonical purine NTP pyrophosphatase [gamma proteobacterium symbiont of Taylorina sp.]